MTSKEYASELEQFHNEPRMTSEELVVELTRLHADQNTKNFNAYDFISAFGSPLEAVMYSKLFWPDFIEIKGMVISTFANFYAAQSIGLSILTYFFHFDPSGSIDFIISAMCRSRAISIMSPIERFFVNRFQLAFRSAA